MDYFAGLDVSVKETSVCIVDDTGRIVREVKVMSEPEALLQVWETQSTASNGSDWKLGRCRNGFSVRLPKQACRRSVSKRGTCGRC
jgi:hypothetical protein